jgi:hypothetical protein
MLAHLANSNRSAELYPSLAMTANKAIGGISERLTVGRPRLAGNGETAAYAFTTHRASEKDAMGAEQTA